MSLRLKIPPPVIGLVCALLMWIISRYVNNFDFEFAFRKLIALTLFCIALSIDVLALIKFKESKTTINPMKPDNSTQLVDSGIYKYTRNPMYLGLFGILTAWGIYLGNSLSLGMLLVFVISITYLQIIPEEEVMEEKFKEKYIYYKQRVRRWI